MIQYLDIEPIIIVKNIPVETINITIDVSEIAKQYLN
jgi:hypothetical protein